MSRIVTGTQQEDGPKRDARRTCPALPPKETEMANGRVTGLWHHRHQECRSNHEDSHKSDSRQGKREGW